MDRNGWIWEGCGMKLEFEVDGKFYEAVETMAKQLGVSVDHFVENVFKVGCEVITSPHKAQILVLVEHGNPREEKRIEA